MRINFVLYPADLRPYGGLYWGIKSAELALRSVGIDYEESYKALEGFDLHHFSNFMDFSRYYNTQAGKKQIVHIHGWHLNVVWPGVPLRNDFEQIFNMISPVFTSKALVVHMNKMAGKELVEDYIWNCCDPDIFYPDKLVSDGRLIDITNLTFVKGIDRLDNVAKYLDVHVIGKPVLEDGTPKRDSSFISVIGAIKSQQALADELRSSSIFIHLSRLESCSLTIIQAMMCGLPIIYTNVGDSFEMVGSAGVCVGGDDVEEILEAERVIRENYSEYRNNAIEEAKKFHPEKIGERWREFYTKALGT